MAKTDRTNAARDPERLPHSWERDWFDPWLQDRLRRAPRDPQSAAAKLSRGRYLLFAILKITTLTIVLLEFAALVLTGPIGLIVAVPVLEVALGTGVGAALVRYFRFGWIPAIVLVALLSWIASQSL